MTVVATRTRPYSMRICNIRELAHSASCGCSCVRRSHRVIVFVYRIGNRRRVERLAKLFARECQQCIRVGGRTGRAHSVSAACERPSRPRWSIRASLRALCLSVVCVKHARRRLSAQITRRLCCTVCVAPSDSDSTRLGPTPVTVTVTVSCSAFISFLWPSATRFCYVDKQLAVRCAMLCYTKPECTMKVISV